MRGRTDCGGTEGNQRRVVPVRGDQMAERFAQIIIDITAESLDRPFSYRIPENLMEQIRPGSRVRIPFGSGNHIREGYVVGLSETCDFDPEKVKKIESLIPGGNPVEAQLVQVADFLCRQYGSSMAMALRTVLPVKSRVRHVRKVTVKPALAMDDIRDLYEEAERKHRSARARLYKALLDHPEGIDKNVAIRDCKVPLAALMKLADQGVIVLETDVHYRDIPAGLTVKSQRPILNEEQQAILDGFTADLQAGIHRTYLLFGVTGSGKTEVYLNMIERVLAQGRQAIVLIPEISLTYQNLCRFYERFGNRITLMHSRMSAGEKSDAFERIEKGEADVVIGARSALFAPVKDPGLIIIDEEHDGAYKSDSTPKYHARETAIFRASLSGASVVLGSATPSMESYYRAISGEYLLLTMKTRAGHASLPTVSTVDMRQEFAAGNRSMFSTALKEKIADRLKNHEQVMLFINRRGYAGFVSCRSCGEVRKCPHCDVSLTYHRDGSLRCHYCGYTTQYTKICPSCRQPFVAAFGMGTEKVETAIHSEFPEARVLRMDFDTTRNKDGHAKILDAFRRGEADILVGTQMIVKGHDYANVTLMGILAADLSLHVQDYHGAERTFALLCQAAGRAGRGDRSGEVVIQTYQPDHYAIQAAMDHNYERFYEEEAAFRKLMGYPPFSHFLAILVQSGDEEDAALAALRISKMIERAIAGDERLSQIRVLNPGPAGIARIKDIYRQVLYLKHVDGELLLQIKNRLEPVLADHPMFADVTVQFDFDPLHSY